MPHDKGEFIVLVLSPTTPDWGWVAKPQIMSNLTLDHPNKNFESFKSLGVEGWRGCSCGTSCVLCSLTNVSKTNRGDVRLVIEYSSVKFHGIYTQWSLVNESSVSVQTKCIRCGIDLNPRPHECRGANHLQHTTRIACALLLSNLIL